MGTVYEAGKGGPGKMTKGSFIHYTQDSFIVFCLPFQSTVKFQSNDDITQELEKFGGMADCTSFR